jgi:hypothetical protein
MEKHLAYFTHEDSEVGHLYYFAPADRAPGPYLKQIHVNAVVDVAADGTLAGVELIDGMPTPPVGFDTLEPVNDHLERASAVYAHWDHISMEQTPSAVADYIDALERTVHELRWREGAMVRVADGDEAEIKTLEAAVVSLTARVRWAHDTLYEINIGNYDHDEVCKLNDASVEVILGLAPLLGEKHGKTDEWWAKRAAANVDDPALPAEITARYWNMVPPDVDMACMPDPGTHLCHIRWMIQQLRGPMETGKAMRWLGFIQGILIERGLTTVTAERDFTRSYFSTAT